MRFTATVNGETMYGSTFLHHSELGGEVESALPRFLSPRFFRLALVLFPLLAAAAVFGLFVVKVDTVSRAQGVVRPVGDTIPVPVTGGGKVAEIRFAEGDRVEAGAVVVALDATEAKIRLQGLEVQRASVEASLERLTIKRELLADLGEKRNERARLSVTTAREEVLASRRSFEQNRAEAGEERERAFEQARYARKKFEAMRDLFVAGLVAKATLDEAELALTQAELNDKTARRREEDKSKPDNLAQERLAGEQASAEIVRREQTQALESVEAELVTVRASLDQVNRDIALARRAVEESQVRAPVGGLVTALAVRHAGEIVAGGKVLFSVVPENTRVLVELRIPNLEMKNVRAGSPVKYTFDAYPSAEYGKATGTLVKVAPDSETLEGLSVYRAWATLEQSNLRATNGRTVPIRIGQTVQAEIVTERKPFLSPPRFDW